MREFHDVFPNDLLGIPPNTNINFGIDLSYLLNPLSSLPLGWDITQIRWRDGRKVTKTSGDMAKCYSFSCLIVEDSSDSVIMVIILVCLEPILVLFDLGLTLSSKYTYFQLSLAIRCVFFVVPIYIATLVDDSLVVDEVY